MCPDGLGAVRDEERVARLFVPQVPDQGYQPFIRKDLLPPKGRAASDVCGASDGASVDRRSTLSDDELRTRSARFATECNAERARRGKPPNRFAGGALVASVDRLRAIRRPVGKPEQIVLVYDDAMPENAEHAVVRLSEAVPEEEVAGLVDDLRACFDEVVGSVGPA